MLRCWQNADRIPFAKMNQAPEVMPDLDGPISLNDSNQKMDRYIAAFEQYGFSRWVTEQEGHSFGSCGVVSLYVDRPRGYHHAVSRDVLK